MPKGGNMGGQGQGGGQYNPTVTPNVTDDGSGGQQVSFEGTGFFPGSSVMIDIIGPDFHEQWWIGMNSDGTLDNNYIPLPGPGSYEAFFNQVQKNRKFETVADVKFTA